MQTEWNNTDKPRCASICFPFSFHSKVCVCVCTRANCEFGNGLALCVRVTSCVFPIPRNIAFSLAGIWRRNKLFAFDYLMVDKLPFRRRFLIIDSKCVHTLCAKPAHKPNNYYLCFINKFKIDKSFFGCQPSSSRRRPPAVPLPTSTWKRWNRLICVWNLILFAQNIYSVAKNGIQIEFMSKHTLFMGCAFCLFGSLWRKFCVPNTMGLKCIISFVERTK